MEKNIENENKEVVDEKINENENNIPNENTKKGKKKNKPKKEVIKIEEPKKTDEEIAIEKFNKMDIRIGTLTEVWKHPDSEKLYCEKIDIKFEERSIASGLQKFIPIEEMKGKVLVLANLKPRKLAGFPSNGMVLCASNENHDVIEILYPENPEECENGDRIYLEDTEPLPIELSSKLNPKHKIFEFCSEFMKTDENGYACFKGKKWMVNKTYIKSKTLKLANIS